MKIAEETSERLILEDRPVALTAGMWFLGFVLLWASVAESARGGGTIFLLASLGLATLGLSWYFFPFQRIVFDRDSGDLRRRIARVTGARTEVILLSEIKSAAGQGNWSEGTRMERIVLLTEGAPYPLEFGFSATSRKEMVDAINSWLEAARE